MSCGLHFFSSAQLFLSLGIVMNPKYLSVPGYVLFMTHVAVGQIYVSSAGRNTKLAPVASIGHAVEFARSASVHSACR